MTSLRTRLSVSVAIVAAFAIGAQWYFASHGIRRTVENQMRSRLEHDAESIASALEINPAGIVLAPDRIGMEYRRAYSGHYYVVSTAGQKALSRSLWDFAPDLKSCGGRTPGPRSQTLMVYCMPLKKAGHNFEIWVAEETTADRDAEEFQNRLTIASFIALLAILAAQQIAVHVGLAPLARAVQKLQQSDAAALSADMPRELQPFAREIERLVEVLKKRLEISRQTAGNLAHEQKTHLASIQAAADSAASNASDTLRAALEEITKGVRNLKGIAERHMARSAMAGEARAGALFDWHADLSGLRSTLLRIYADRELTLEIAYREVPEFCPERQDGIELFGILLDNACRFARTKVTVIVERAFVEIEDDGPGCSEDQMKLLAVRGARVDENTESGLGLSIARDIAESYGWTLDFAAARPAGLKVRLVQAQDGLARAGAPSV